MPTAEMTRVVNGLGLSFETIMQVTTKQLMLMFSQMDDCRESRLWGRDLLLPTYLKAVQSNKGRYYLPALRKLGGDSRLHFVFSWGSRH